MGHRPWAMRQRLWATGYGSRAMEHGPQVMGHRPRDMGHAGFKDVGTGHAGFEDMTQPRTAGWARLSTCGAQKRPAFGRGGLVCQDSAFPLQTPPAHRARTTEPTQAKASS